MSETRTILLGLLIGLFSTVSRAQGPIVELDQAISKEEALLALLPQSLKEPYTGEFSAKASVCRSWTESARRAKTVNDLPATTLFSLFACVADFRKFAWLGVGYAGMRPMDETNAEDAMNLLFDWMRVAKGLDELQYRMERPMQQYMAQIDRLTHDCGSATEKRGRSKKGTPL